MDDKPTKPKRVGNHYIPPPARKQGTEQHEFSRVKERPTKLCGSKQEKLCDDSSLLFKDSSPKVEEKTQAKRKSRRSSKKANAENTSISIAAETQPVLPSYADSSNKEIFQHSIPHNTCDGSDDKILVKSHLPLNDLENTRLRGTNNVEIPVKFVDNDTENPRQLVVIPCSFMRHCTEDRIEVNHFNDAAFRPNDNNDNGNVRVFEISEAVSDNVIKSEVFETEYPTTNRVLGLQEEETCVNVECLSLEKDIVFPESSDLHVTKCSNAAITTCDDHTSKYQPESQSEMGNFIESASTKRYESKCPPLAPVVHVSKSKDPRTKTRPPSDGCQDQISLDEGDWDSIYDDSGDCLIPRSTTSSPKDLGTQVEIDLAKMKISPKQPVPEKTYENCSSIIEIYGFSEELKTNDLLAVFGNFINKGFNLKWVDNTHALGIFPSPFLAEEALTSNLPLVKTRPIDQGTSMSQERARTMVLPSSLRPKTCSALARRLVSGALGLRVKATPEERAAERELLREAREKKKLVTKQRDAAWEGNFSSLDGCEENN